MVADQTANPGEASPPENSATRRIGMRGIVVIGTVLLLIGVNVMIWLRGSLETARIARQRGNWSTTRAAAERYLILDPGNLEARMLAADGYFQDDSLDSVEAARAAISHYQKIPDQSEQGGLARSMEGRAAFLVLQEPSRAERLFLKAIEQDPDLFDAHYLLWQLDNMTERFYACEQHFREVYRLCPVDERPHRLREWYFSQFSPLSACGELDLLMGFRQQRELPSEEIAFRRLSAFAEYEPNEPNTLAALAQWHLRNQSREAALQVLEKIRDSPAAQASPFYMATLLETLIELGQFERADEVYAAWPKNGQEYYAKKVQGIYFQEVQGELEKAFEKYTEASEIWPGPTDWLMLNRRSRCLALLGRKEESAQAGELASQMEAMTDLSVHTKIRNALMNWENPNNLETIVDFYESLSRPWEANSWREVAKNLPRKTRP
ncbi:MAG: hypothetical protein KDA80_06845 [Planctomycetaceae bacterium]|nr:hypothetical protein [Planctomycetaceae bacterium]